MHFDRGLSLRMVVLDTRSNLDHRDRECQDSSNPLNWSVQFTTTMSKSPDFIIIGAMKCATSTLHDQLAQQPGIFMSELKEPNFFSNDDIYVQGWEWYASHFEDASPQDLCGESSTHYTKLPTYPDTVERIRQSLPEVKLIYVMRHPVERLVSQYIHEWSQRVMSEEINTAVDQYPELIEYSRYTVQLQPFFDTFGPDRILPVFFERLATDPQAELERIGRFIGYSGQPTWEDNRDAQNVSTARMRQSLLRDLIVEAPGLRELRRLLIPKSFRLWVRSLWTMKDKPELASEKVERLEKIFDEDLKVLGSWLGMSLSCENFKETVCANSVNWSEDAGKILRPLS